MRVPKAYTDEGIPTAFHTHRDKFVLVLLTIQSGV